MLIFAHAKAIALKIFADIIWYGAKKIDQKLKAWLATIKPVTLTAVGIGILALDLVFAFGNGIPWVGIAVSTIDAVLGPIDEILLTAWPAYRVAYEVARRITRRLIAQGKEVPKGLQDFVGQLEAEGTEAHAAVSKQAHGTATARAKAAKPNPRIARAPAQS